jgi:hypothetical protein
VHRDRLAGDAGVGVELRRVERLEGVDDPDHLALAGSVVGRGDIERRADEVLLDQLRRVAPDHPLPKPVAHRVGIDPDSALGPAEGDVDERALEGHERRQGHHLVLHEIGTEADPALGGEPVVAVLHAVGLDDLDPPIVPLHRKPDQVDRVAGAHRFEDSRREVGVARRALEVPRYVPEEAVALFSSRRHLASSCRRSEQGVCPARTPLPERRILAPRSREREPLRYTLPDCGDRPLIRETFFQPDLP